MHTEFAIHKGKAEKQKIHQLGNVRSRIKVVSTTIGDKKNPLKISQLKQI